MDKVGRGREFEYKTARILWERFSIVTFPFPGSGCDLITEQGVRIEVRSGGNFFNL